MDIIAVASGAPKVALTVLNQLNASSPIYGQIDTCIHDFNLNVERCHDPKDFASFPVPAILISEGITVEYSHERRQRLGI